MKNAIILICMLLMVCGCSLFDKKPPVPDPTRVVIDFDAAADINPNVSGRASTVIVRIYQLTSSKAFEDADFIEIYEDAAKVLGGELEDQQEIYLKPSEKRTVHFKPSEKVESIGIIIGFRDYSDGTCKTAVTVRKNRPNVYRVDLKGSTAHIK